MLSPAVGACRFDVKCVYMELRPRLSRLYSVMADPEALAPIFVPLGFAPVGEPVDVGGVPHQPVWLDSGEGRGPLEPRDRRAAGDHREDGGAPRLEHLLQAGRAQPGPGRARRRDVEDHRITGSR
jgi:hypothetical protein